MLAATLQGWGGERLLDSFGEERRPVFQSTARDFIEQAIHSDRDFLAAFDPERDLAAFEAAWAERRSGARAEVNVFEPNYEGSSIVWGPPGSTCSAKGSHRFAAEPGHHLAPQPLSSGKNVFDQLGRGFTLIDLGAPAAFADAFARAAERLSIPLALIRDTAADGRERYATSLILVRPDQFVAWASSDACDDAETVLRQAIGANL
jgi:hypothetical protein